MSDPQSSPSYAADDVPDEDVLQRDSTVADRPTTDARPVDRRAADARVVDGRGPSRAKAHLTSLVLCLLLTPAGLIALDYALQKGFASNLALGVNDIAPTRALIGAGVCAGVFLVVAALGRLSGLGPLLAGLVWGALPAVAFLMEPITTARRLADLPDPYNQFMVGLTSSMIVFPVITGLLFGVAFTGRWRRSRPARTL